MFMERVDLRLDELIEDLALLERQDKCGEGVFHVGEQIRRIEDNLRVKANLVVDKCLPS
jgi:hypothetical protein